MVRWYAWHSWLISAVALVLTFLMFGPVAGLPQYIGGFLGWPVTVALALVVVGLPALACYRLDANQKQRLARAAALREQELASAAARQRQEHAELLKKAQSHVKTALRFASDTLREFRLEANFDDKAVARLTEIANDFDRNIQDLMTDLLPLVGAGSMPSARALVETVSDHSTVEVQGPASEGAPNADARKKLIWRTGFGVRCVGLLLKKTSNTLAALGNDG